MGKRKGEIQNILGRQQNIPVHARPTPAFDNDHDTEPFCCRRIFNLLVGAFENTATTAVQVGVAKAFQSDTERKAFPRDWDALGTKNMAVGCWRAPQSFLMMDMYLGGAEAEMKLILILHSLWFVDVGGVAVLVAVKTR